MHRHRAYFAEYVDYTLNEKWLADFLTLQGVFSEICIDETAYSGIKQLLSGHHMRLSLK
ncbi:hypothetical protein [Cellulosilyticum ruminicola]|uniref:hypothetical protein n=1 Tax=Cellulosilyticum ruminicola TaxID=425254 RepID=UPI0012EE2A10|nr:hypothetical protein [Cellulosilyticum ruminicola]